MDEIEVKILDIDVDAVTAKLRLLGAKMVFAGEITAAYYDSGDTIRESGRVLRLRTKGEKSYITYKIKKESREVKVCDELETEIGSIDVMDRILKGLSYEAFTTEKKHRTTYRLKDSLIEIEIRENIPPYLEIESQCVDDLWETVRLLGFAKEETKPWSGKELISYYEDRPLLNSGCMK